MSRLNIAIVALAALAAASTTALGEDIPDLRAHIGPVRLAMTPAEMREALPQARWRIMQAPAGTQGWSAADALTLAGLRFGAVLQTDARGFMRITFAQRSTADSAAACEDRALAVMAEVEAQSGPLQNMEQLEDERALEEIITLGGSRIRAGVIDGGRLAPRASTMSGQPEHAYMRAARSLVLNGTPSILHFRADYYGRQDGRPCGVEITLQRMF